MVIQNKFLVPTALYPMSIAVFFHWEQKTPHRHKELSFASRNSLTHTMHQSSMQYGMNYY